MAYVVTKVIVVLPCSGSPYIWTNMAFNNAKDRIKMYQEIAKIVQGGIENM